MEQISATQAFKKALSFVGARLSASELDRLLDPDRPPNPIDQVETKEVQIYGDYWNTEVTTYGQDGSSDTKIYSSESGEYLGSYHTEIDIDTQTVTITVGDATGVNAEWTATYSEVNGKYEVSMTETVEGGLSVSGQAVIDEVAEGSISATVTLEDENGSQTENVVIDTETGEMSARSSDEPVPNSEPASETEPGSESNPVPEPQVDIEPKEPKEPERPEESVPLAEPQLDILPAESTEPVPTVEAATSEPELVIEQVERIEPELEIDDGQNDSRDGDRDDEREDDRDDDRDADFGD